MPEVRLTACNPERQARRVHRMLGLPEVQIYKITEEVEELCSKDT